jgi:glycerol uptake facilitator-like aquaporin
MDKNYRAYLAELIGTFAVVFLAAGAVCVNQMTIRTGSDYLKPGLAQNLGIALVYGLAYAAALAAVLPLSTGYLNPAIPLMFWVFKRLDGLKTTALIFVQLLGAVIAGGLLRLIFTPEILTDARLGTPHVNLRAFDAYGITAGLLLKGVVVEFGLTFILTFIIYATIIDPRAPRFLGGWGRRLIALWVGLAVVAITLAALPLTGAAVNPARWFGPVVWEFTLDALRGQHPFADHLVYWFGPIAGALVAGVVYNTLLLPSETEHAAAAAPASGKVAAGAGATLFRAKK